MKRTPPILPIKSADFAAFPKDHDPQEKILTLAPMAVDVIERIIDNPKAPLNAQIQAIDIILNRAFGRPEGVLKMNAEERTPEESGICIQAILERIKAREGAMSNE